MPITLTQGLTINAKDAVDDRTVYPSRDAALTTGGMVNGVMKPRIAPTRRYDGMPVWLQDEECLYRFIGGTADSNFIPDPGSGGLGEDAATQVQQLIDEILPGKIEEAMEEAGAGVTWTVVPA